MRLINVQTLEIENDFPDGTPEYAILSHTWGSRTEVTYEEWQSGDEDVWSKPGYKKIWNACREAQRDGLSYLWCDTNCIRKTDPSELSEAINSMFIWYRNSAVCYAYLEDVEYVEDYKTGRGAESSYELSSSFARSRWWTRGWTLQELVAPKKVQFYDRTWRYLGSKKGLASDVYKITGITLEYLPGHGLERASIAQRMSWLSHRKTTRTEDMAYCMLGIFGINMPLLYGEGPGAFLRLQEEIIKVSNDQTIFCWTWMDNIMPKDWPSILAPSPAVFSGSGDFVPSRPSMLINSRLVSPYAITNAGLSIRLQTVACYDYLLVILDVVRASDKKRYGYYAGKYGAGILLRGSARGEMSQWEMPKWDGVWERLPFPPTPNAVLRIRAAERWTDLYIRSRRIPVRPELAFEEANLRGYGILFTSDRETPTHDDELPREELPVVALHGHWDRSRSLFFLHKNSRYPALWSGIVNVGRKSSTERLSVFFAVKELGNGAHIVSCHWTGPDLSGSRFFIPRRTGVPMKESVIRRALQEEIRDAIYLGSRRALSLTEETEDELTIHQYVSTPSKLSPGYHVENVTTRVIVAPEDEEFAVNDSSMIIRPAHFMFDDQTNTQEDEFRDTISVASNEAVTQGGKGKGDVPKWQ